MIGLVDDHFMVYIIAWEHRCSSFDDPCFDLRCPFPPSGRTSSCKFHRSARSRP